MTDVVVVTSTAGSEADAAALARAVIEARLGACAQVGRIDSVYRWQGEVHSEPEWRIDVKTTAARADEVVAYLRERHPYDEPEVIVTPVVGGSESYLAWVAEQTR
jgi:periplasmic divalent cation tolerance protein